MTPARLAHSLVAASRPITARNGTAMLPLVGSRRILYRNFKQSRVARRMAEELAAQFKTEVDAYDQHRPRWLLRFLLGP